MILIRHFAKQRDCQKLQAQISPQKWAFNLHGGYSVEAMYGHKMLFI